MIVFFYVKNNKAKIIYHHNLENTFPMVHAWLYFWTSQPYLKITWWRYEWTIDYWWLIQIMINFQAFDSKWKLLAIHLILLWCNIQTTPHKERYLTCRDSSKSTWSYSLRATQKMIDATESKQWIHFLLSDRCPPTSNMLKSVINYFFYLISMKKYAQFSALVYVAYIYCNICESSHVQNI